MAGRIERIPDNENFIEPRILIPWYVKDDIDRIINVDNNEVGWIGEREKVGNDYRITKVLVTKQNVDGSNANITVDEMYQACVVDGELDHTKVGYWGHKHPDGFGVRPSSEDDKTMWSYSEDFGIFLGTIHTRDVKRGGYIEKGEISGYMVDSKRGLYLTGLEVIIEEHPDIVNLKEEIYELEYGLKLREEELQLEHRVTAPDWETIHKERVARHTYKGKNKKGKRGGIVNWQGGSRGYYGGWGYGFDSQEQDNVDLDDWFTERYSEKPSNPNIELQDWAEFLKDCVVFDQPNWDIKVKVHKGVTKHYQPHTWWSQREVIYEDYLAIK